MPDPDSLTRALDEQRIRRQVDARLTQPAVGRAPVVTPVYRAVDEEIPPSGYELADWLLGLGMALCAVGIIGGCTWRLIEALP